MADSAVGIARVRHGDHPHHIAYRGTRETETARPAAVRLLQAATKKGIDGLACDPDITVQALVRALLEPTPPARIATGWAAHYIFKPLSWLPDKTRDAALYAMTFPGAPPAGLAK